MALKERLPQWGLQWLGYQLHCGDEMSWHSGEPPSRPLAGISGGGHWKAYHRYHQTQLETRSPSLGQPVAPTEEKLRALETLMAEQLEKECTVPLNSPWNTPLFVIKKPGKDIWRLFQDLRKVNDVIKEFGSSQPGMPTQTMLPWHWPLTIIDIKGCFFIILLHPHDAPCFAFSVPSLNCQALLWCYHWLILPQGMKNSPVARRRNSVANQTAVSWLFYTALHGRHPCLCQRPHTPALTEC